jgi:hypothetical protein
VLVVVIYGKGLRIDFIGIELVPVRRCPEGRRVLMILSAIST